MPWRCSGAWSTAAAARRAIARPGRCMPAACTRSAPGRGPSPGPPCWPAPGSDRTPSRRRPCRTGPSTALRAGGRGSPRRSGSASPGPARLTGRRSRGWPVPRRGRRSPRTTPRGVAVELADRLPDPLGHVLLALLPGPRRVGRGVVRDVLRRGGRLPVVGAEDLIDLRLAQRGLGGGPAGDDRQVPGAGHGGLVGPPVLTQPAGRVRDPLRIGLEPEPGQAGEDDVRLLPLDR